MCVLVLVLVLVVLVVLVVVVVVVLQTLASSFGWMLSSVGGARKVFEYLDRKPQISSEGKLRPDAVKGHVTFHRVHFAYPSCPQNQVLQVSPDLRDLLLAVWGGSGDAALCFRTFLWS